MTGQAVIRRAALVMTVHTKPHCVIHHSLGYGHLRNITMTGAALNFSPNVWTMIETNMSLVGKSIDALPGNIFAPLPHRGNFLDLGFVHSDKLVTLHAVPDVGNPCLRAATCNARVTGITGYRSIEVGLVGISNRLLWLGSNTEEMPYRLKN
jgi:hypothetical protein